MVDLSAIPQCGSACIISSLSTTSCAPLDTACLCADQGFADAVTKCVVSNCTVIESLVVKNATMSSCGYPEPNQDRSLLAITVVLITLQTTFFALRMLCRAVRIAPWGWDDTTIVIAFVLTTGFGAGSVLEARYGLGRNIWTLRPDQINTFLQIFYVFETAYSFVLAVIKISICFLYLRIFPGPKFRKVVWATQIFNIALLVTFMIADGLQCRPISFFWLGWDGEHEGSCIDLNAFGWAHGGINIVLDVWMLVLPASQVWKLNLPMRKKAGVLAMFGFGILLTVISLVRLQSLRAFAHTTNPTSDFFGVGVWSAIEITAGLIVACMPAARLVVVRYVPRVFSNNRSRLPSGPHPARSGRNYGMSPRAGSSKQRLHKKSPLSSLSTGLSSNDLDRNRQYSMRVTVSSSGKFGSTTSEQSQYDVAEEGIKSPVSLEEPRSAKLPPPGAYLGVPERLLTPSESQMDSSRRIWVTQDVSVIHQNPVDPLRSKDVQDEKAETESRSS